MLLQKKKYLYKHTKILQNLNAQNSAWKDTTENKIMACLKKKKKRPWKSKINKLPSPEKGREKKYKAEKKSKINKLPSPETGEKGNTKQTD